MNTSKNWLVVSAGVLVLSTGCSGTDPSATGGASSGGGVATGGKNAAGGAASGGANAVTGGAATGGKDAVTGGAAATGGKNAVTGGAASGGTSASTGGQAGVGGTSGGGGAAAIGGASSAGTGSAPGRFYVVGKDIVGPDGNLFFPFGANVAASIKRANGSLERPWTFDSGGTANGHSDAALAWGWNAVRVTFVCYYDDQPDFVSAEDLERSLAAIVDEYTARKIVVMPECHDDTGRTLPLTDPHMKAADAFFSLVFARHKNNPYVWINPLNEMTNDSSDATQLDYWKQITQHYIDMRNAAGAENILVLDIPGYATDAKLIAESDFGSSLAKDQCNLVFSWHSYGWDIPVNGWTRTTARDNYNSWYQHIHDRQLALIVGEYGYDSNSAGSEDKDVIAADLTLSLGYENRTGSFVWHGTSGFALVGSSASTPFWNGSTGQGLSNLGQKVWDAGHNKPSMGTFTGNIAASRCASAQ